MKRLVIKKPNPYYLTNRQKEKIIELYFCLNDKRLLTIGNLVGTSGNTVSNYLDKHFKEKVKYKAPDYKLFISKINL